MENNYQQIILRINQVISKKTNGVIIIPQDPSVDAVASACALYLALIKLGKNISLICSTKLEYDIVGVDKFKKDLNISGDTLMISFPYVDGAIDKIDWRIEGDIFYITITPQPGYQRLDPEKISYSYTGGKIDFIFVLDSPSLKSLGDVYQNNQDKFQGVEIINIDRHLTNENYGTINFNNKMVSSLSEMVFQLIKNFNIEIDKDIATNLYVGLTSSTNNFSSYSVNAQTFETAAALLRLGAVKKTIKKQFSSFQANTPSFIPSIKGQILTKKIEEKIDIKQSEKTPSDWLKPKIFKGGGLI